MWTLIQNQFFSPITVTKRQLGNYCSSTAAILVNFISDSFLFFVVWRVISASQEYRNSLERYTIAVKSIWPCQCDFMCIRNELREDYVNDRSLAPGGHQLFITIEHFRFLMSALPNVSVPLPDAFTNYQFLQQNLT